MTNNNIDINISNSKKNKLSHEIRILQTMS